MSEEKKGDVVSNKEFKTAGDWINEVLAATNTEAGAVDPDAIAELCEANGVTLKDYPNLGMVRMNAGNMLRSRARKRHGLFIDGVWVDAPAEFCEGHDRVESPDGSRIPKAEQDEAA